MKINSVKFLIDNSPTIARLVHAHGAKPPQLTGDGVSDRDKIGAWMAYIAMLASGEEPIAHNGSTFTARVEAAKELMIAWERLHLTSIDASQQNTTREQLKPFPAVIGPAWDSYAELCVPPQCGPGTRQYEGTKMAFYSGLRTILIALETTAPPHVAPEISDAMFDKIADEVKEFYAEKHRKADELRSQIAGALLSQILGRAKR